MKMNGNTYREMLEAGHIVTKHFNDYEHQINWLHYLEREGFTFSTELKDKLICITVSKISVKLVDGKIIESKSIANKYEEKNKMNNDKIEQVIDKYYRRKEKNYTDAYIEAIKTFKEETKIIAIIKNLEKSLQKLLPENMNVKDVYYVNEEVFLTKEELVNYQKIKEVYDRQIEQLEDWVEECRALLSIAETYEQKESILNDYGILG